MRRFSPSRGRRLTRYEAAAEAFAASRVGSWCFLHVFDTVDRRLLPLTRGRLSVTPGAPVGLLETVGARSGRPRRTPVLYTADGAAVLLVASNGGGPRDPAWLHNVRAHPEVRFLARGGAWRAYRAAIADPADRARLWPLVTDLYAGYAAYAARAAPRVLGIVVLTPR
jgi:deazaflavin-dependent oxidoreductase (nitroreductase family)